jgi:putative DNA primase/helicase
MGTYATTAPLETFMASRSDRHPTELVGLHRARLVTVTETEPGRHWAESRIKSITGGDRIQARLMHRDFFEFMPSCKLIIAGNHRPRLTGYGEAMRRRLHLIPCRATIPAEDRDRDLLAKLRRERGGILAWALAGCSEWQRLGLAPPEIVRGAASDYFDEEDLVGQWIADCCLVGQRERDTSQVLFASWTAWVQKIGVGPGSAREFGERLSERGFLSFRGAKSRGWSGLRLRPETLTSAVENAACAGAGQ